MVNAFPQEIASENLLTLSQVLDILRPTLSDVDEHTLIPDSVIKNSTAALSRAKLLSHLPLKHWALKNFKSVKDSGVDFAPLTVIVGQNSAGKSSLLQSLLLFAQNISTEGYSVPLNGAFYRSGVFRDLLNSDCKNATERIVFQGRFTSVNLRGIPVSGYRIDRVNERLDYNYSVELDSSELDSTYMEIAQACLEVSDSSGSKFSMNSIRSSASPSKMEEFDEIFEDDGAPLNVGLFAGDSESNYLMMSKLSSSYGFEDITLDETEFVGLFPVLGSISSNILKRIAYELIISRMNFITKSTISNSAFNFNGRESSAEAKSAHERGLSVEQYFEERTNSYLDDFLKRNENHETIGRRPEFTSARDWARKFQDALFDFLFDEETDWLATTQQLRELELAAAKKFIDHSHLEPWKGNLPNRFWRLPIRRLIGKPSSGSIYENFFSQRILYLGPLRKEPAFSYSLDAVTTPTTPLGLRGENTFQLLSTNTKSRNYPLPDLENSNLMNSQRITLMQAVNHWIREFFGESTSLTMGKQDQHGVAVRFGQQSLPHVGVGVSQLLPVIVVCLNAQPGQIVLLEQPELHLHPALQQKLADFLLAMVDSGRQIVVETHSEYLITRLRLRTVQNPSNAELFNIVFATNAPDEGTTYSSTTVDSNGSLNTWPDGFFEEATSDLEKLMNIVLERD